MNERRSGTDRRRRVSSRAETWLQAALAVAIIVAVAVSAGSFRTVRRVDKNTRRIDSGEVALRDANFRICGRANVTRAEIHNVEAQAFGPASLRRLRQRLPILDCRPNLFDRKATPLSVGLQRAYVRAYAAGTVDPATGLIKGPVGAPAPERKGP